MINNRQNGRRGRGRNGVRPQGQPGRPEQGNRIDNRSRGNAVQLHEKYKTLARDAQMQGDRVLTEYYNQFADHYFRVLSETRARSDEQRRPRDEYQPRVNEQDDDYDGYEDGDAGDGYDDQPRADQPRNDHSRNEQPRNEPARSDQRQERPDRQDRSERQEQRPERQEQRADRAERPDRGERQDRQDRQRPERQPRPERIDRPAPTFRTADEPRADSAAGPYADGNAAPRPAAQEVREVEPEGSERRPRMTRAAPALPPLDRAADEEQPPRPERRPRTPRAAAPVADNAERIDVLALPPALSVAPAADADAGAEDAPRRRRTRRPRADAPTLDLSGDVAA